MTVSADSTRFAIVRQTGSPPITPATPVFISARMTGESLAFTPETTLSAELDPTGQVKDSILTGGASAGDVQFEVSNHGAFEEYLVGVFGKDWVANVLTPGTTLFTYLVEKTFQDVPTVGAKSYHRFDKSAFSNLSLTIAPGSPITGAATISGGLMTLGTTILTGATYPTSGTESVLVPSDVTIAMDAWAATSCFGNVTMNFNDNVRGIQCIGTLGNKDQVRGRFEVAISAEVYYSTDAPVQALLDQDEFPVTITLDDAAGVPEYTFSFPRCKLTAAPVVAGGTNTDVMVGLELNALYDSVTGYTCQVTRGV